MSQYRWLCGFGLWVSTMIFLPCVLLGDITGTILGTVTDPSGAAIPGAEVTLRNPNTGYLHSLESDSTGSFVFLSVPVGDGYVIEVSAKGFEKSVQSGIKLLVNQSYRVDMLLQVGSVTQEVTVLATPVQVESTSTQLGDVIEDSKMTSLPLNGRSYIDLLGLQTGVVPVSSGASGSWHTVSGDLSDGVLSVNGNRESANEYLVNGGDVEESTLNGASVVPSLDSIQEFRLLTGSFDAEYGRFSGGVVNVVTKSGTNAFHGDAYEFVRNNTLDSRNFFETNLTSPVTGQELPGTAIGEFRQNQFGGTIGGPILKDRLFFFTDYQGTRQVLGSPTGVIHVPSFSERGGDFSDVATTGYSPLTGVVHGCDTAGGHCMNDVLTERLGYTVTNGEPYWVPGCNTLADAQAGTCVFPGQVIPQSAWSPAAAGTLKFIPTATGSASGTPFYSTSAYKGVVRDDKFAERIDFENKKSGNWSAYYHFDDASNVNPYAQGNLPALGVNETTSPTRAQQINLSNTRNFGATLVNDWRLNVTRFAMRLGEPATPSQKVSNYGFVEGGLGLLPTAPAVEGVPIINLTVLGDTFGYPGPSFQFNNTYQVAENLAKITGKHTLKFGADGRYFQINMRWRYNQNGNFFFYGSETGNDFADYLLGAPSELVMASPGDLDARSKYFGLYGQDSYKLRPNFTINYGLRWEFSQPWSDTRNRLQAWVPGVQSERFPNSPLGWVFDGDPGVAHSLGPTRYDNIGPRLGFAYSPGFSDGVAGKLFGGPGKTSIRASFGMFYTAFEQLINNYELGNAPFSLYYVSSDPVYLEEPFEGRAGYDPGQRFPYVPPAADTSFAKFQPIAGEPGFAINNVLPYTESYNFTLQRQIKGSTILTLGYVGTLGRHLITYLPANSGNQALCLQVRQALGPINGCGSYGEDTIYDLPNGQVVYGTRQYSVTSGRYLNQGLLDIGDIQYIATLADSSYNALEFTVEKKVGALRLLAAYTWSKSLDDSSGFTDAETNPYNHSLSRSLSAFDMANNLVLSYTYDLPFQKLSRATSGPVHKFLDGWQVSGITRFATGFPVLLTESGDHSLDGDYYDMDIDMPDYNGQPIQFFNPRASAVHQYMSSSQFSTPDLGLLGTSNRRFFHGPGLNNWDLALHKMTRVSERTSLEFRAELFNAFNHAQFINPVGDFNSSAFGEVTSARNPRIGQFALKFNF